MRNNPALRLVPVPDAHASDLGPLIDAHDIARDFLNGKFSAKWVLAHVAPKDKRKMGREVLWRRAHVEQWMREYEAECARKAS